jgi:hypothetical protein
VGGLATAGIPVFLWLAAFGAIFGSMAVAEGDGKAWRPGATGVIVCVAITTVVPLGLYIGFDIRHRFDEAMQNVMVQAERAHEDMAQRAAASISGFARDLERIDLSACPSGFQETFREYRDVWADFGAYLDANAGIPGIATIHLTGGVSLPEAWLNTRIPEKILAIRGAEQKLRETVGRRPTIRKNWRLWLRS